MSARASAPAQAGRVAEAVRAANAAGHAALVVYLPAGFPDMVTSRACLAAAAAAGADLLEIGIPYSDPVMDGPVIQRAAHTALEGGTTPPGALAMCAELTAEIAAPALAMTYYNIAWRYPGPEPEAGDAERLQAFAAAAGQAGLAGAILPDLPAGEGAPWRRAAAAHGLDTVFLAAPSSTDTALADIAAASTGFVYATSVMGVTGARASLSEAAAPLVRRLRPHAGDTPICVGLGVSRADQAAELADLADGVIVGSAVVDAAEHGGPDAVAELVAELAAGCRREHR